MSDSNEIAPLSTLEYPDTIYQDQVQARSGSQPADPNNPPWGIAGALLVWLITILLQVLLPPLFLVPYALNRGLNPGSPNFAREVLEFATSDRGAVFVQVLAILPIHILTFALVWAFVTRLGRRPFLASLGWQWNGWLGFWSCAFVGIGLFLAAATLAKLLGAEKPTQLEQIINSSLATRYMIAALAVFTAPFVEEFVYRGVLYSALQRAIGVNGGVIFVLALFTLIHVPQYWPNIGVIAAVGLLSIVLTIVRAYSGRLLPCVVIHLVFNLIQAVLLVLEPYSQSVVPQTQPAPAATLILQLTHYII